MDERDRATILMGFLFFILFVLVYVLYRLVTDPPAETHPRSVRLLRWIGYPKFFDPLLAKPLTKREKIGWLLFFLVLVLGILFVQLTGLGVGRHGI
jgi:predicted nucleic acid-binding Zn ribbon protein